MKYCTHSCLSISCLLLFNFWGFSSAVQHTFIIILLPRFKLILYLKRYFLDFLSAFLNAYLMINKWFCKLLFNKQFYLFFRFFDNLAIVSGWQRSTFWFLTHLKVFIEFLSFNLQRMRYFLCPLHQLILIRYKKTFFFFLSHLLIIFKLCCYVLIWDKVVTIYSYL